MFFFISILFFKEKNGKDCFLKHTHAKQNPKIKLPYLKKISTPRISNSNCIYNITTFHLKIGASIRACCSNMLAIF